MSSAVALASFCRLCLSNTENKLSVFEDENMPILLHLIDIQIDPDLEPGAIVCLDCIVTLEGFFQFKEQCHVNDEFVKTIIVKKSLASQWKDEEADEDVEKVGQSFVEVLEIQEEDSLELSEAEEAFPIIPQQSVKPLKDQTSAARPQNNCIPRNRERHTEEAVQKKISTDKLHDLGESCPDNFYFEKNTRSNNFTLVFNEERYDSALYAESSTYWQCIHRKKYQCPAQVWVKNDYKTFKQRYKHTHNKLSVEKGETFTPQEALPEISMLSKKVIQQNRTENVSFEEQFQKFAAGIYKEFESSPPNKSKSSLKESESDAKIKHNNESRQKRRIKPNSRYTNGHQHKKLCLRQEPEVEERHETEPENDITFEEDLDLDKLEEECKNLKIRKRSKQGPSLDEQLVLDESYPDYFFFEKYPRSMFFTLVFYGERFHSAMFTEYYTYWHCRHRRKHNCPAQVRVSNDYKTFERRYEHNHPDIKVADGEPFTPTEALPAIFEACRKAVIKNRAKLRKKLLEKHLQTANLNNAAEEQTSKHEISVQDFAEDQENEEYAAYVVVGEQSVEYSPLQEENSDEEAPTDECRKCESVDDEQDFFKDYLDLNKLEEECKTLKIRKRSKTGPSLDEQLVLAESYPDYFFFEKFSRSPHLNLVYYGEQFFSAVFTEYYTYWHCRQRRRHDCPALVRVTNDYKSFERRYEHNHPDILVEGGEAFTPIEALPKIFEACRNMVLKYRAKRCKKMLEKYKVLRKGNGTKDQKATETNSIEEVFVADPNDAVFDEEFIEELIENET